MPLPFNPMAFVTPYTAIGQGHIGAGAAMANAASQMRQNKVSEGYLANQQHTTAEADKRYAQQEIDKARAELDNAMMLGNSDAVEAAANNLRAVAARHGYSLAETRSDAKLTSGVKTELGDQKAAPEVGSPENPLDVDAYDAEQARKSSRRVMPPSGVLPRPTEAESNARIDESLKTGGNQLMGEETTTLDPTEEKAFQAWAKKNGIADANDPQAHYDYRGFWLQSKGAAHRRGDHFPDTFKQHGHETFSEESQYSTGAGDGGRWNGESFAPAQRSDFTGQMAPALQLRPPGGVLPKPASAAEPPGASEAPLQGYTINGPDGKPLYSVAPKDVAVRQRQRVSDVFAALADKTDNPDEQALLHQGQAAAEKLVGVVPIDQAVKEGLLLYTQGMQRRNALMITDLNHKGRSLGGGAPVPGGLMGKNEDRAESIDKYGDNIEAALQHRGIPASEEALAQAEGALQSGDPALQKDALKLILKARSGLTVSEKERASYTMVDGAIPALQNAIAQWTGDPLDPQTVRSYLNIVRNMHQANTATSQRIVDYERHKYEAQNRRKVSDDVLKERSQALDPNYTPSGGKTPGQKLLEE